MLPSDLTIGRVQINTDKERPVGKRLLASVTKRKRFEELMDGTKRATDAKSGFTKLATRLFFVEAGEAEACQTVGHITGSRLLGSCH